MCLSAWIILGLIAGFISSHIVAGVALDAVIEVALGSVLLFIAYYVASRKVLKD